LPDYATKAGLHDIVPFCAYQFNTMVTQVLNASIGLGLAMFFSLFLMPLMLAVVTTAVKGATYILCTLFWADLWDVSNLKLSWFQRFTLACCGCKPSLDSLSKPPNEQPLLAGQGLALPAASGANNRTVVDGKPQYSPRDMLHIETMQFVIMVSSVSLPLVLSMPLVFLVQLAGNASVFWSVALVVAPMITGAWLARSANVGHTVIRFQVWCLAWIIPLLAIAISIIREYIDELNIWERIQEALVDAHTYLYIVANVGLSVVVVSDVLYQVHGG